MLLENELIKLRAPEPTDLEMFYKWENDSEIWQMGSATAPISKYAVKQYISSCSNDIYRDGQLRMMIERKSDRRVLGMVDLFEFDGFHRRAAVGILIDREARGQGIGAQAVGLLTEYAKDFLGLNMLFVHIPVSNQGSINLFKKCGYVLSGELVGWLRIGNRYENAYLLQYI